MYNVKLSEQDLFVLIGALVLADYGTGKTLNLRERLAKVLIDNIQDKGDKL